MCRILGCLIRGPRIVRAEELAGICGIGNQDHQDMSHHGLRRFRRRSRLKYNISALLIRLLLLYLNSVVVYLEQDPHLSYDHQQIHQPMLAFLDLTADLRCHQATFNSLIKPNLFERVGRCPRQVH